LTATPEDILQFWFGDALAEPAAAARRTSFWFGAAPAVDEEIARRFGTVLRSAVSGALAHWESQARSCLAVIVVLDQFPRNIYRGTSAAFACDAQALGITRRGVAVGYLRALRIPEQAFFLMPFQHAEDRAAQREGLALFERLHGEAPAEWRAFTQGIIDFARLHLDIVERFGRFPHRNGILGRVSTAPELEYLAANSQSFGQSA
jgi:uncharacterized protein (DUF924 family)